MPPDRFTTCEYHLGCEKVASELHADHENMKQSVDMLWVKFNLSDREVQQHTGVIGPLQRDVETLKNKLEIRALEEQSYQTIVRGTRKDVDEMQKTSREYALKKETATLEGVEDLRRWVRYGWLTTLFAMLLLIANMALVIIPLIWKKG